MVGRDDWNSLSEVNHEARYHGSTGCVERNVVCLVPLYTHEHSIVVMQGLVLTVTAQEYIRVLFYGGLLISSKLKGIRQ